MARTWARQGLRGLARRRRGALLATPRGARRSALIGSLVTALLAARRSALIGSLVTALLAARRSALIGSLVTALLAARRSALIGSLVTALLAALPTGCGDDGGGNGDPADAGAGTDATAGPDAGADGDGGFPPDAGLADGGLPDGGDPDGGDPDGGTTPACGEITTFAQGLTPSRELHVAPGGDDSTGDGSAGNPYGTIAHAAGQATPGTAVRIHSGTYGGVYLSDLNGTAVAPIWLGGVPGQSAPVISGASGEGLHLTRVSYLVVHDLEITGFDANGINCDDGGDYANPQATHHVVFRDLYVHDIGSGGNQDCLKLSGVNDFFVLDSEIHHCGGGGAGSGVDHVGCHRGLIARNYVHHCSGNAVQAKGGSEDLEIRANHFVDCGERTLNLGGSTGDAFFRPPLSTTQPNAEARNLRAVANLIEGSEAPIAYVGCVDCLVAHNTLVNPNQWIARILQERVSDATYTFAACAGGRFVNNLVYYERGRLSQWEDVNVGANTEPGTFEFTTNLFYAHDDPGSSAPALPGTETGTVVGDPAFSSGYAIDPGSPAFEAGTPGTGVAGDRLGVCYHDPPSIGAHEVP